MRRYFFHVLAFCAGTISGVVASFIVLLIANFGLHRLPRALSFFLHAVNKEVIKGCAFFLILALFVYTACGLLQKNTGKLRPNSRYIISAIAGAMHPLLVTAALLTVASFAFWQGMTGENQVGTVMGAVFGSICIVGFVARRFTWEIKPGLGFCHSCGYDLRMLDASQCPECGEPIIEPVQITEIRSDDDLASLERSPLAVVYLQHPEDRLETDDWVWFVRKCYRNEVAATEFFSADVTRPAIKRWLERGSNSAMVSEFDRMAVVTKGVVIGTSMSPESHLRSLRKSFKKSRIVRPVAAQSLPKPGHSIGPPGEIHNDHALECIKSPSFSAERKANAQL